MKRKLTEEQTVPVKSSMWEPVESRYIAVEELEPHPDALAFWGAEEEEDDEAKSEEGQDVGALANSVASRGNATPALVVRKEGGEGWWLLDGCGRLAGAKKGGRTELYCTVFDLEPEHWPALMLDVNMHRRRVSSGSRVLRYLELYANEVLEAAEANSDNAKTGRRGGRGNKRPFHGNDLYSYFSGDAIRERLCCRRQDVSAGIMLLKCLREEAVPYRDNNQRWQMRPGADGELVALREVAAGVRKGRTPLNRWAPGFLGKVKTEVKGPEGGRAPTDYARLMDRSLTSLQTVFANWQEMEMLDRLRMIERFCALVRELPADYHKHFREAVAELFPELADNGKGGGR